MKGWAFIWRTPKFWGALFGGKPKGEGGRLAISFILRGGFYQKLLPPNIRGFKKGRREIRDFREPFNILN